MQIAEVKIRQSSKPINIEVGDMVKSGDWLVVENDKSIVLGKVLGISKDSKVDDGYTCDRIATDADIAKGKELDAKAVELKNLAKEITRKHNADMKIVDAEFSLDGSKIMIYFVAEDRVDFRELVKELAAAMKLRIELRQIGIRDQAKMIGCMGVCGKECCCKQYLSDFDKVSIKMAKTQSLSLNPTKISGTCGRLMCCLAFENDTYAEACSKCPKVNACVCTPDGKGTVVSNNVLKQTVMCRIEKGDDIKITEYSLSQLSMGKGDNIAAKSISETAGKKSENIETTNKPQNVASSDKEANVEQNISDNMANNAARDKKRNKQKMTNNSAKQQLGNETADANASEQTNKNNKKKKRHYRHFDNRKGGQA